VTIILLILSGNETIRSELIKRYTCSELTGDPDCMKNLIWLILGAALIYYFYDGGISNFVVPQHASSQRSGTGIKQVEFMSLFDQKKSFSSLASNKHYTVVEVYLNTCSICKRLEQGFGPFVKNRQDVIIQRVHFPESGMNFTINSQQEAEEIQSRIESYQVCGTPHVEIYGPGGTLVTADNCGSKEGTKFLRHWISAETSISRMSL